MCLDDDEIEEGEIDMPVTKQKLYSFIDGEGNEKYGTHIGTNSKGQYLVEVKGKGGDVVVLDKMDLTPVVPHTVKLKAVKGTQTFDVQVSPDDVQIGSIMLIFGSYDKVTPYVVTQLDTKNGEAKKLSGILIKDAVILK